MAHTAPATYAETRAFAHQRSGVDRRATSASFVAIWPAGRIGAIVISMAVVVFALGVAREFYVVAFGLETFLQEGRHFDLDGEANLPTWFSAALMAVISFLCVLSGSAAKLRGEAHRWAWRGLALVFGLFSLDEVASFHEAVMDPLRALLQTDGVLYYAWVVPAIPLVIGFALIYLPFLGHLPKRFAALFVASGALYVGGALGLEMVGGFVASTSGEETTAFAVATTIEEGLEIAGLTLFTVTLLHYAKFKQLALRFG
ncbi:MAG: hypothetical protein GXP01_07035 [Alphaproteobacteria bacterium]|nr:hypothetical protein [Alphaproteobacteria bacterium]